MKHLPLFIPGVTVVTSSNLVLFAQRSGDGRAATAIKSAVNVLLTCAQKYDRTAERRGEGGRMCDMAFKGWRGEMGRREEYSRRSLLDWRT